MNRTITLTGLCALALSLATPAYASNPLLFEWSGVDDNSNPFNISYTVRDVQNGEAGFDTNDFDATDLFTATESTTDKQVITDVTGDIFAGTHVFPTADAGDPYYYVETRDVGGNTLISMFAGSDTSDIGLTYNGAPVDWVVVEGTANFPFVSPATATSFADLFPVGTYTISTDQFFTGDVTYNGNSEFITLIPTALTISIIPEPTSLTLLALGGLSVLRRRP